MFVVDYSTRGFFNPPARPNEISDYGRRLARACVGPDRGSGGTVDVQKDGIRGEWTLKFGIFPATRLPSNETMDEDIETAKQM